MVYMKDEVAGYRLGALPEAPVPALAEVAREAAAEGMVLLENSRGTLPLTSGDRVSLFGRGQMEYCKSGTGSGGLVNVTYVTNILDSLRETPGISVNETLTGIYAAYIAEHPFDKGKGWAQEPWAQEEMPLSEETVKEARAVSDKALVVICRTAGEDKDNSATRGSWYLTETEEDMIAKVTAVFDRVCVVLNVGNIMDMSWVKKYGVDAVLYAWQGGMEGGRATVDVLTGRVNPSGRLADTIARDIADYPAAEHFGDPAVNLYTEDIYVGYRYFETFAPEKVLYPFGYGLSYTTFDLTVKGVEMERGEDTLVTVTARVKNTGKVTGREVVEVYLGAPQGKLGKPEKVLAAFAKTAPLAPGKSETLTLSFLLEDFASFDDSGVTGHKNAYLLEAGQYLIYVGTDVHTAEACVAYSVEEKVVREVTEALTPVRPFERLRPDADGKPAYESVPTRTYDLQARIRENRPKDIPYTGDRGIKLVDVRDGRAEMDAFLAQFTNEELIQICRGEGMNSPKVTPGTGSCFGGVTDGLLSHGVPIACTTDGPSGLRMDSGMMATSLPNGTLLACTWNLPLVYRLFVLEGVEMTAYSIDCLLGPGINIHRHPLNGRNFEYFSEDPFLTGRMAAAMCTATNECGVYCTIKHFMGNNQEWHRHDVDAVMSARAAREIYLRPFEIAVKEGGAQAIMTSYNPVNGIHAASNYDLNTTILRGEWGYAGYVMTDWWARMNDESEDYSIEYLSLMIRAQNDVYMVTPDAATRKDDGVAALEDGRLTRGEAARCAANLCRFLMHTHAFERYLANGSTYVKTAPVSLEGKTLVATLTSPACNRPVDLTLPEEGTYVAELVYHADTTDLAQIPVSLIYGAHKVGFLMVRGTNGATEKTVVELPLTPAAAKFKAVCPNAALVLEEIRFYR
ncbi:MAG: glycoside hydrolase family 3 C-terminal domain-containing protein [Clostridia bacterium]|nr:glycoside hydrolase family 3 C-terminal domain-containing protein [Clostridia bacterium]MDY6185008.1 glycoside hydrolase family 3 C-terminal domain-containing protein [Eubacteriales bacterium]